MKNFQPYIPVLFRMILGVVLIVSGMEKIPHVGDFARAIDNYHILPFGLENLMAILLPWVEIVAGISLIGGFFLNGASLITGSMMVMFILAIASAMLRGYNIECGCGLKEGEMVGMGKIIEDIIYLFMSLSVYFRKHMKWEVPVRIGSKII